MRLKEPKPCNISQGSKPKKHYYYETDYFCTPVGRFCGLLPSLSGSIILQGVQTL